MTQILLMRGGNHTRQIGIDMTEVHRILGVFGAGAMTSLMSNGNTVCQHDVTPQDVAQMRAAQHGRRPMIIALKRKDWHARVAENRFDRAVPKRVPVFFDASDDIADMAEIEARARQGEEIIATSGMRGRYVETAAATSKLVDLMDALPDAPLIARSQHRVSQIHPTACT